MLKQQRQTIHQKVNCSVCVQVIELYRSTTHHLVQLVLPCNGREGRMNILPPRHPKGPGNHHS